MSAGPAYKAALVSLLSTAFASDELVQVSYGHPGPTPSPDIVAVMGVSSEQVSGPLGPARKREETLTAVVVLSSYAGGGAEVQQVVTERAFALLSALETAVRADPSIGGLALSCAVVDYVQDEDVAYAPNPYDAGDPIPMGRVTEISVQIRAVVRI